MAILEKIRLYIFWFLDAFKKFSIGKHYKEIKFIIENPEHKDAKIIQQKNLQNLIEHARTTTAFYANIKGDGLLDFPIIDKNIIINNFDDFMSQSFKKKDLIKHTTSGSTGVPFQIFKDKNKISRNSADVIYFSELAEYKLGNQLVYIRLWVKKFMKHKFVFYFQNVIPHNILKNSTSEILKFLDLLRSKASKKILLVYPSYLEEICRVLDTTKTNDLNFNVKAIITNSEKLNDYEKERAQHFFKCPVYERYSNMENGILAQNTTSHKDTYLINYASYFVEVLDVETNLHVKNGEIGKIVVTDLFNYATPVLRYDTGDLGRYSMPENGHAYFSEIYGRRMDAVYNSKGVFVSPHIFYKISHFSKLKQFQFIQNSTKEYTFKLNADKANTNEQGIVNHFKTYLGDDAIFNFEYVKEIAKLESGKFKKVVNLMSN